MPVRGEEAGLEMGGDGRLEMPGARRGAHTLPQQYIISPSAPLLTEPKREKTSIDCCVMSVFGTVVIVH